jgi:osmotically-inducible protein OsmY
MRRVSRGGRAGHPLWWTALGAALATTVSVLFDPRRGAARRAMIRDQASSRARSLAVALRRRTDDLRCRAAGAVHELRARLEERGGGIPDERIEARVRSQLGRPVSHPGALEVRVRDGCVEVSGPILAHEVEELLHAIRSVRGVRDVVDRLDVRRTADVAALQGDGSRQTQ